MSTLPADDASTTAVPLHRRPAAWGAVLAAVVLLVVGSAWFGSLVPGTLSVVDMGRPDFGGGPPVGHGTSAGGHVVHADDPGEGVSVSDLTGPDGVPDVRLTLTARRGELRLATGERVHGYTLNGSSPGPAIEVVEGQLLEVTLVNESVPDGVTLHWHGVDVPNAEDGVAGVTQDAVRPGGTHVYRFVAEDPGTYWYHSHQLSHPQVLGGLFGSLVVHPDAGDRGAPLDVVVPVHTYQGIRTAGGRSGGTFVAADAGQVARVRVVNTDNGAMRTWVDGAAFVVAAVDGHDVHEPTALRGRAVHVAAGARVDLVLTVPDTGVAVVRLGAGTWLTLGPEEPPGAPEPSPVPQEELDLLGYGTPAPLGFDPAEADRRFDYTVTRRPGFIDGRPGLWWAVNGRLYPDVPMYMVAEGDVAVMTIRNSSGVIHPMHLHGHHVVVLSRNGEPATGSPWWVDTLDVAHGDVYEVAFVADNPGIWLDHCHHLKHAADGMVGHVMYAGVSTPYVLGGEGRNRPE